VWLLFRSLVGQNSVRTQYNIGPKLQQISLGSGHFLNGNSSWPVLGHAVPCLNQPWVKNDEHTVLNRTIVGACKTSFGPDPVLLHHSISSVWVQQRMSQCASTGNSWPVLSLSCCALFGSALGEKQAHCPKLDD
jgi:hypothetical protein